MRPTLRQLGALALARALLPVLFPTTDFDVRVGPSGRVLLDARDR